MNDLSIDSLVARFYQSLYHFALSLARSEVVAADLTQETYYLWAAKGHQLRDTTKVKSWLFTTLHREFLRRERHSTRFPHHETSQVEHELPVVASTVVNDLDAITVMQALQRVDEHYRVPVAMFYLEDFSYKEIAEALDLPAAPSCPASRVAKPSSEPFSARLPPGRRTRLCRFPMLETKPGADHELTRSQIHPRSLPRLRP